MFDPKKLEHFLDGLQAETHFPNAVPQKIVEPPRTELDQKMDRYDIFRQLEKEYEAVGPAERPLLVPRSANPFNNPMYVSWGAAWPLRHSAYASNYMYISGVGSLTDGNGDITATPPVPVETPYDRLKAKLARLSTAAPLLVSDPTPPAPLRSPDFVHVLTAWRGWEVSDGLLEALGSNTQWEPKRAQRASCQASDHAAPNFSCHCGYWSFKSFELLQEALVGYANIVDVIGQVEIWGRVIECENGWRSEFAYPKELWLVGEGLESLSWKYGVPVRKLG